MDPTQYNILKDTIIPLIAAFIGALIGGIFTLKGVNAAHKLDLNRKQKDEEAEIKSFLQMIKAEIKKVWERYDSSVGIQLETLPTNQPFLLIFPVSNNYFTVYENNTSIIGKIPDESLREEIVGTYILAKGLLDSYKMNNESVKTYAANKLSNDCSTNPYLKSLVTQQYGDLAQYATQMKIRHNELKQSVEILIKDLNKFLSKI